MSSNRTGRHMASKNGRRGAEAPRRRREPLRDNYTYEQPRSGSARQGFEDVSSYSSSQKKRADEKELKRQKKQGMSRGKKAALIILSVILVLAAAAVWYVFGYLLKDLTVDSNFTKDREKLGIITGTVSGETEGPVVLDDSVKNIAMFGVDARDGNFEGNSDVVMILTVDNKHGKIKMTSVLRDSCVILEDGSYAKLTELYGYGGPELAVNTLNRNFSIGNRPLNISEYVTVNFSKMAKIIDACGGVELELTAQEVQQINVNLWSLIVDVENEIENDKYYGTYTNRDDYAYITGEDILPNIYGEKNVDSADYEYEGGKYLLNGNQAVAYGRIRYIDSDDVRAARQQNVLKALIQKVKGKSKLEYPEMIRKIMPLCKTSLDFGDIMGMLPIMFTDFSIETMNIPGEDEHAYGGELAGPRWVYVYDLDFAAAHISRFIYESDSPYYNEEIYPGMGVIPDVPEAGASTYAEDPTNQYSAEPPATSSEPVSSMDPSSSEGESSSSGLEDPSSGGESSGGLSSEDPNNSGETSSWSDPSSEDPVSTSGETDPGTGDDPGTMEDPNVVDGDNGDGGDGGYAPESDEWGDELTPTSEVSP